MASSPAADKDPMWSNREATKINVALAKAGLSEAGQTEWWNHCAYAELGGITPGEAWQREQYAEVQALVERLLSEALADQVATNPTILTRLEDSRRV
jgi:hypothetical protein